MLELDAQSRRDSIAKYKTQQYQTRKNDEFQAISQEIHRFEQEIERIEDHEIELMEQTEQFQKEAAYAEAELKAAKRQAELQQADLKKKESTLGERLKQAEIDSRRRGVERVNAEACQQCHRHDERHGDRGNGHDGPAHVLHAEL